MSRRALDVFADFAERLTRKLGADAGGQVAKGDDADQTLAAVEHGQPADLFYFHQAGRLVDILVVVDIDDLWRHDGAHRRAFWIAALGHAADDDVAVGNRAGQPVMIADRKEADAEFSHDTRRGRQTGIGADTLGLLSHDFCDFHGGSSYLEFGESLWVNLPDLLPVLS